MKHPGSRLSLAPVLVAVILIAPACSTGGVPVESSNRQTSVIEQLTDATWSVEFTLDSVREGTQWTRASSGRAATGTIHFGDHAPGSGEVTADIDLSFVPLLGREMSCFEPGTRQVILIQGDEGWRIQFTPHAADCGFGATVLSEDGAVAGEWDETSLIGPVAVGHVRFVPITRR